METARASQDQLKLSEQGQVTDRYTKAIDQLDEKHGLAVRLGGLYALERIARDSRDDRVTIAEVLCAYARTAPRLAPPARRAKDANQPVADMRARALKVIGCARLDSGDVGGLADLERAVAVAVEVNSPECVRAYVNLASCLVDLGDLARAFKLQADGWRAAERFGLASPVRHLQAEQVFEHYWRGRWDAAIRAADEFIAESEATTSHYMDSACRLIRGRIRLARGDSGGALQDADQMLAAARVIGDPQVIYPALAFRASISVAAGDMDQAAAYASDLLTRLADQDGVPSGADWPADLAVVLQTLGRGKELAEVVSGTASTPWLQAAMAMVNEMFEQAADLYAAIGSLPDEAIAHLRAAQHLVATGRQAEANMHSV